MTGALVAYKVQASSMNMIYTVKKNKKNKNVKKNKLHTT